MARLQGKTARRYVKALYEVCGAADLESYRDGLASVADVWKESPELQACLLSPAIPSMEKQSVVRDIAGQAVAGNGSFTNFLLLLLDNHRIDSLAELVDELDRFIQELKNLLSLTVTSAFELREEEKSTISSRVEQDYGSLARISWDVDPEIIGGLLIQAGDRQLDNSVRSSLAKMRASLLV